MKRLSALTVGWLVTGLLLAACGGAATPTITIAPTDVPPTLRPTAIASATGPLTKITIGMDPTYPPFDAFDPERKELRGFDYELMQAIAAKSGLDIEYANVSYTRLLTAISICQLDGGISAIPVTEALKQKLSFSEPYFSIGQVIVVKKGNITITGRDTLAGMTVGTEPGTPAVTEIENIPGAQVAPYQTFDVAFQDLINGLIDAVVAEKPVALSYVGTRANNLKIIGGEFATQNLGIAVCNQKPELLGQINRGLAAVKADGTLDRLTARWLKDLIAP